MTRRVLCTLMFIGILRCEHRIKSILDSVFRGRDLCSEITVCHFAIIDTKIPLALVVVKMKFLDGCYE